MNKLKVRMELQLEAGDQVNPAHAVAEALESHLQILRLSLPNELQAIVEVPRGRLAYVIEVKHVR